MTAPFAIWLFLMVFVFIDCLLFAMNIQQYEERHGNFRARYVLVPGSGLYVWRKVRRGNT